MRVLPAHALHPAAVCTWAFPPPSRPPPPSGNWKWIITPVSPTATKCYLHLNNMTEYTIKPVSPCIFVF